MSDDKDLKIGDVIKKVVSIGVGAAFMTEDAVKNVLKDLPLPKEIVNGLLQNAKNAKEDFAEGVRDELGKYLSKVDPKTLLDEMLDNYDVEVNAKFSFKRKSGTDVTSKDNG
jgi:polyhydroxyalkanoate synthesis regulator phasin